MMGTSVIDGKSEVEPVTKPKPVIRKKKKKNGRWMLRTKGRDFDPAPFLKKSDETQQTSYFEG